MKTKITFRLIFFGLLFSLCLSVRAERLPVKIYTSADGTIFVANGDFNLSRFDGAKFHTRQPNFAANQRLQWTSRYALLDRFGDWWILTRNGLYRFAGGDLLKTPTIYGEKDNLKSAEIFQIYEDQRGANLRREVFLIFKESLNNIVKHSGASRVEIKFDLSETNLTLEIADNGSGFAVEKIAPPKPPAKLLENIREAMSSGALMSPEVAMRVVKLFRDFRPPEHKRAEHDLTPHELRLLKLLTEGYSYSTAAQKLGVSYNTIKFHVRHIFEKLQVHSKSEAVVKALRDRLV